MKKLFVIGVFLLALAVMLGGSAFAGDKYAKVLNAEKPGMQYDISKKAVKGKTTIFDFYSVFCGPCVRLAPALEKLDRKRSDIVVYKMDINRFGIRGIDWRSPLAIQYKLRSIPSFYIYNGQGKITHSGSQATRKVIELLKQSNIKI